MDLDDVTRTRLLAVADRLIAESDDDIDRLLVGVKEIQNLGWTYTERIISVNDGLSRYIGDDVAQTRRLLAITLTRLAEKDGHARPNNGLPTMPTPPGQSPDGQARGGNRSGP